MTCKKCGRRTGGVGVGPGKVLPLCGPCLARIQRTLGDTTDLLNELRQVLQDLDVSNNDAHQVTEALFWTDERREAWENLPEDYRLFIRAMGHVNELFRDEGGLTFVDLPEPVLACIRRCSRAALFSTIGDCLQRTLGDFNKLLHVMEIFDYEHFDYEDPPEPLASLIERGAPDELFSMMYETLDVLLGNNGLKRIKAIRGSQGNGEVRPHPSKQREET